MNSKANSEILYNKGSDLYDRSKYKSAFRIFFDLAQNGHLSSMSRVALMYSAGLGVERNFEESIKWDKMAISLGESISMFNLAITYRNLGQARSARMWFERAIDAGDMDATLELAKMYFVSDLELDKVERYLLQCINSSNATESSREEASRFLAKVHQVRVELISKI